MEIFDLRNPNVYISSSPSLTTCCASCCGFCSTDLQSPPTVLCDFCGQLFETRKALSCHVRAHLRQLGLTWSIRTSPIDLLKEVMLHGEDGKAKQPWAPQGSKRPRRSLSAEEGASTSCTSPVDYSMKDKSPPGKTAVPRVGKSPGFRSTSSGIIRDSQLSEPMRLFRLDQQELALTAHKHLLFKHLFRFALERRTKSCFCTCNQLTGRFLEGFPRRHSCL